MGDDSNKPPIAASGTAGESMQVDKIHDIRRHLADNESLANARRWPTKIGVVSPKFIRVIAFVVISTAVMACAVCCVLAVWGSVEPEFAWRALGSLGIVSAATAVFVSLNEGFGPTVRY